MPCAALFCLFVCLLILLVHVFSPGALLISNMLVIVFGKLFKKESGA